MHVPLRGRRAAVSEISGAEDPEGDRGGAGVHDGVPESLEPLTLALIPRDGGGLRRYLLGHSPSFPSLDAGRCSFPRMSVARTPAAATAAQTISALLNPVREVRCRAAMLSESTDPAHVAASARPAEAPPRPAKMAPASATLRLWPTTRPVASRPEASPCLPGGTAFISAREFGVWNMPWPTLVRTRYPVTSTRVLPASSRARKSRPTHASASPPAASQREPMRSASEPLTGATTAMVRGRGVRSRPDFSTEKPRSSSK